MEDVEYQEPIFELATECEALYATQISRLSNDDDPNAAKLLSDVYQRFSAWAAFLGVFAEANVCLDRRLRRHVEIQDQVLRLLDIMQKNLSYLFEDDDLSKHVNIDSCERDVRTPQSATVNTKSLDGISGALERLNQLGTAIRQSSVTNQIFKAREFAAEFDMTSFEQLANALVQKLFPDATNGLIELLTRSMAESYALFLHRKSRQKRLQITRHVPRSQKPLMRIPDETTGTPDGSAIMEVDLKALRVGDGLNNRIAQAPLSLPVHSVPESEPTSVDSKELHKRLRTLMSPTENTKPVSILVNQAEYPRPSKTSIICEWCFGPLTTDFRDDKPKWQEHINEDFKPYICLSEKCAESMPRFASSWQWLQHMGTIHGGNWHREVYAPASWVCPLCTKVDVSFSSPEDLSAHLEGCHTGIFEDQQLKAIVRQSLFRAPRPQETCPLCCFSIGDGQAPQANQESTPSSNQHMDHNAARPDDSHFKRLKTDTGYTERDDHTNANVDERNMSIENPETRDNTVSKNRIETRFIGSHVAAHLQIIMLLTLRLISIDGTAEEQPGSQCGSSEIGSQASWFSSEPRGLDQEMSDIDRNLSPQPYENADIDTGAHLTENVPDSEPIHWDDVLGRPSNAPQDQNVTVSAVEPLAQPQSSIEDKGKTLHDLSIYYNTIKELVDSEYLFGNDMKVLDDVYKGTSGSCAVISADDIRIIFRNSDEVTQLSLDFQVHLRQATKGVYIMPRSQHRSNRQSERSHTPFINDEHSASPAVVYLQANDIHSTSAGQAFMAHSTRMQEVYMKYLMKHDLADKRLRDLEKTPKVAIWLQECLKGASDLTTAGDLHTLLARPIHRMLNYPRIFETLLSFTPTDHPDWQSLDAALKKVTHINVTVNEAMKQQTLIRKFSRENRSRQTRILRALDWRSRKTSTISDPDSDKEYAALSQSYDDNMFQLQVVIRDMENYMSNFTQQINNFMDVIDRFDELVQVNAFPSSWSELEGKWRVLKTSIQDIKSAEGSAHLDIVQRCVMDPLVQLLKLYAGPKNPMTSRDNSLSDYSTFMAAKERGERSGKKTTENAQIFIALNETLKSELPKLYTLTARLAHTCLHNLVQIEKAWFYLVQKKLGPLIDSFSDNTQDILDDWAADFRLVETQILKLGICNGSLLENTLFTHRPSTSTGSQQPPPPPQPPPQIFGENDSSIIDTEPDAPLELSAWRDSTRPDPSKRQDLNLPRAASPVETELAGTGLAGARPNVLFLAASVFEFNIDYFRKEAGYPWLTYAAGEIFEIVGEKGELWLANNLDDPTHNLGWIWNKHFAKLPQ